MTVKPSTTTRGQEMTLATYYAKKAIKAQWQAEGRSRYYDPRELAIAARAYVDLHREELVIRARAALETFAQNRKR